MHFADSANSADGRKTVIIVAVTIVPIVLLAVALISLPVYAVAKRRKDKIRILLNRGSVKPITLLFPRLIATQGLLPIDNLHFCLIFYC